ncbi:Hypothetical protein CINCED_3A007340 [Cinara cedri]|nr:Hypothetical protein CINCED_3A007340 [Cinara cedri]
MAIKKNEDKLLFGEKNLKKDLWFSKRRGNLRMENKKIQRIKGIFLETKYIKCKPLYLTYSESTVAHGLCLRIMEEKDILDVFVCDGKRGKDL